MIIIMVTLSSPQSLKHIIIIIILNITIGIIIIIILIIMATLKTSPSLNYGDDCYHCHHYHYHHCHYLYHNHYHPYHHCYRKRLSLSLHFASRMLRSIITV